MPTLRSPTVQWILLTAAGWCLGFALLLACIGIAGALGLGDFQFPIGLGMGLGVGIVQAQRIRRLTGRRRPWIVATALGTALPFAAWDAAELLGAGGTVHLAMPVAAAGLLTGWLQARALRPVTGRPLRWVAASLTGWCLAATTLLVDYRTVGQSGPAGAFLYLGILLAGGPLLGAAQALALPPALPGESAAPPAA